MPRFRLRYQATDLEMPVGDFVIGRSSSCSLALDDGLVSRRHAVLHVGNDAVTVEDMDSRNGVTVNGKKINGEQRVRHLDRVVIGSQEMVLIEVDEQRSQDATSDLIRCSNCSAVLPSRLRSCPKCGAKVRDTGRTLAGATLELRIPGADGTEEGAPPTSAFRLISGIAEKAFAMGRFEEAERILAQNLDALLLEASRNPKVATDRVAEGVGFALRLAEGLKTARWIDWTFTIHQACDRLMDPGTIDRLYELVRKARYGNVRPLRDYLAVVQRRAHELSAGERFLLKRLEGLERVITA